MPSPLLVSELLDFAIPVWAAEPAMNAQDTYKWLYQATRGAEHAVSDGDKAFAKLETEWNSLSLSFDTEPLWQPLRPDGLIGRLHLRPIKNSGGSMQRLFEAFLASGDLFRGDRAFFVECWLGLGKRLEKNSIGSLSYNDWAAHEENARARNYPAYGHGELYKKAHQPAYRILITSEAKKLLQ